MVSYGRVGQAIPHIPLPFLPFFFLPSNKSLNRSSTATLASCLLMRRERGSVLKRAKRGSDMAAEREECRGSSQSGRADAELTWLPYWAGSEPVIGWRALLRGMTTAGDATRSSAFLITRCLRNRSIDAMAPPLYTPSPPVFSHPRLSCSASCEPVCVSPSTLR